MGFSLKVLSVCDKNACTVLNTAFQIFSAVTKSMCQLRHHTFHKSQKYLYSGKNIKKNFFQLLCSTVLLQLNVKFSSVSQNLNLTIMRFLRQSGRDIFLYHN